MKNYLWPTYINKFRFDKLEEIVSGIEDNRVFKINLDNTPNIIPNWFGFNESGGYYPINAQEAFIILKPLTVNTTVTVINLDWHNIKDEGAKMIADVLRISRTLTKISLERNGIEDVGIKALADALRVNNTLTQINLSDNPCLKYEDIFRFTPNAGWGIEALIDCLKVNNSLTRIDLTDNVLDRFDSRIALKLAEVLEVNHSLTSIDLHNNKIKYKGAIAIAKALESNYTLTAVNLRSNCIQNEGAIAIAKALKINSTVRIVDLAGNDVKYTGALELANALKINKGLTKLDLSFNPIEDKGILEIAKALVFNRSITELILESTCIDHGSEDIVKMNKLLESHQEMIKQYNRNLRLEQGLDPEDEDEQTNNSIDKALKVMIEALKFNHNLIKINLHDNKIEDVGVLNQVNKYVQRNSSDFSLMSKLINQKFIISNGDAATPSYNEIRYYKLYQETDLHYLQSKLIKLNKTQNEELDVKQMNYISNVGYEVDKFITDNYLLLRGVCKNLDKVDKESDNDQVSIHNLPSEVISYIFSFLGDKSLWIEAASYNEQESLSSEPHQLLGIDSYCIIS